MHIEPLHPGPAPKPSLETLADNPVLAEQEKLAEASRQFEAMLLRQILTEAQKPLIASTMEGRSFAAGIYRDLMVNELAVQISRTGEIGLARNLQQELMGRPASPPADSHKAAPPGRPPLGHPGKGA